MNTPPVDRPHGEALPHLEPLPPGRRTPELGDADASHEALFTHRQRHELGVMDDSEPDTVATGAEPPPTRQASAEPEPPHTEAAPKRRNWPLSIAVYLLICAAAAGAAWSGWSVLQASIVEFNNQLELETPSASTGDEAAADEPPPAN